jgi:hypothetical protein
LPISAPWLAEDADYPAVGRENPHAVATKSALLDICCLNRENVGARKS